MAGDVHQCVTDGPHNYGTHERATITVRRNGAMNSKGTFKTENNYDYLTIGGTRYMGSNKPMNVQVSQGDTFTWVSDYNVQHNGWTVCLEEYVAPTAAPTLNPTAAPPPLLSVPSNGIITAAAADADAAARLPPRLPLRPAPCSERLATRRDGLAAMVAAIGTGGAPRLRGDRVGVSGVPPPPSARSRRSQRSRRCRFRAWRPNASANAAASLHVGRSGSKM